MRQFELDIAGRKVHFKTSFEEEHIQKMQEKISTALEMLSSPDLEPKSIKALLLLVLSLVSENIESGLDQSVGWNELVQTIDGCIDSIDDALQQT